jgi:acyl carrier protein
MDDKKVFEAMESALQIEPRSLTLSSSSTDIVEWDSLGQLSILTELDKLFDGKVAEINEMAEADSVESIIYLLKNKGLI